MRSYNLFFFLSENRWVWPALLSVIGQTSIRSHGKVLGEWIFCWEWFWNLFCMIQFYMILRYGIIFLELQGAAHNSRLSKLPSRHVDGIIKLPSKHNKWIDRKRPLKSSLHSLLRIQEYRILYRRKGEVLMTQMKKSNQNQNHNLAKIYHSENRQYHHHDYWLGGGARHWMDEHNSDNGKAQI